MFQRGSEWHTGKGSSKERECSADDMRWHSIHWFSRTNEIRNSLQLSLGISNIYYFSITVGDGYDGYNLNWLSVSKRLATEISSTLMQQLKFDELKSCPSVFQPWKNENPKETKKSCSIFAFKNYCTKLVRAKERGIVSSLYLMRRRDFPSASSVGTWLSPLPVSGPLTSLINKRSLL